MTAARRLAHLRLLAATGAIALPILMPLGVTNLLGFLFPGVAWLPGVFGVVMLFAGAAGFVFFAFRWRPRCPQCSLARARFSRTEDREYLACPSCGYRDETGYTWSS